MAFPEFSHRDKKYFLDSYNGDWYFVKALRRKEWAEWKNFSQHNEESRALPRFAVLTGSQPNQVEFDLETAVSIPSSEVDG